jgi:hypothetical protein
LLSCIGEEAEIDDLELQDFKAFPLINETADNTAILTLTTTFFSFNDLDLLLLNSVLDANL